MKNLPTIIGLFLFMALAVSATAPIPRHPPAPLVTATKAVEIAEKFADPAPASVRYCSSVTLVEGGMTPAPNGSARHWLVIFQDAGGVRQDLRQVYVDMNGTASDTVPALAGQVEYGGLLGTKATNSPQALLDVLKRRKEEIKSVYLTLSGSTVFLKDGTSLQTDSTELQQDLAKAAKDAGVPYAWE